MFKKAIFNAYNLYTTSNISRNYFCYCKSSQISGAVLTRTRTIVNFSVAKMCSAQMKIASFEDVVDATKDESVYIIDVREPSEVNAGEIPNSINIPLGDVENALKNLSDADFENKYGRAKPSFETPIIFSCRSGKRAGMALESAKKIGYNDLKNYAGSWLDWESRMKD